ncbi:MAG: alpha/beta hydrolase [Planctomycetes bacterium]|nr:alpha/beta hydrolase [Planctomycetota bacterium]
MTLRYWMISNRNVTADNLGRDHAGLTYWVADVADRRVALDDLDQWHQVSAGQFRRELIGVADGFPCHPDLNDHEQQRHVTLFVHGYNNTWGSAATQYAKVCQGLFHGTRGLGVCVLFTWPSDGMVTNYLPDRMDAERAAPDLAEILSRLYDWALHKQEEGARDPHRTCRAKVSMIAHSMGNYVVQKAMPYVWTRKNRPLLVSLINQLVMVAADVDNDLFRSGEEVDGSDGDAIANLTYRVTSLFTGRDTVLGMSAGLKHFGKRRLGRSGLDADVPRPDNVWEYDCSRLIGAGQSNVHSAYFDEPKVLEVMRKVLRGVDRGGI